MREDAVQGHGAARGSALLAAAFVVVGLGNYAYSLTVAHLLPLGSFGVFALAQSFLVFSAWFSNAGFPWTAARHLSRAGDAQQRAVLLRGAIAGNVAIASTLAALLLVLALAGVLRLGRESAAPLVVAALACSTAGMNAVLRGGLQGTFRFGQVAIATMLETVVKIVAGVLLARSGLGATGAALGILAGLVASSAYALAALRGIPVLRVGALAGAWLWRETRPLFVGFAGMALLTSIDLFAVKIVAPSRTSNDQAGLYTAAVTLARMPFFVATALTTVVFPYVARAGDNRRLASAYVRKGLLFSVVLLAPVSLGMVAVPRSVVTTFYPGSFAPSAVPLRVMAMGTLCLCVAQYLLGTLQASGDDRIPARGVLAVVVLELAGLGAGLPLAERHGSAVLLGAAAAIYDAAAASAALFLLLRARRFGIHVRPRAALAFTLGAAASVVVLLALPHSAGLHLVSAAIVAGIAYAAVAQAVGLLSRDDLALLLSGLRVRQRSRALQQSEQLQLRETRPY